MNVMKIHPAYVHMTRIIFKHLLRTRERARNQHNTGVFLNTHVKKETLVEFVRLYDDFIQDMFRNTSFGDDQYQRTWNDNLRIRPRDLDNYSLESMIENRKDACLGRYRKRDRWCEDD